MSRTKKRIKKFLKKALPAAALVAGATALGRRRKNQANVEMDLPTSNMTERPTMADVAGKTPVYPDAIMRGGTGVQSMRRIPGIQVRDDGSIMAGGVEYANKAAYANRERTKNPDAVSLRDIGNFIFPKANFKDGGKVVKTGEEPKKRKKKIGIQIRGFGKARRG